MTKTKPRGLSAGIRSAREAMQLEPSEAADLLGVGRSTYYSWEAGVRTPRSEDLPRIAAALRTSVGALYGESTR